MRSSIISWIVAFIFLNFTCNKFSQARNLKKLNYVVVIGNVSCDYSTQDDFSKAKSFISGASVVVECEGLKLNFRREVKTNQNGEFKVRLPFPITKHAKQSKGCSVKLLKSSKPLCAVASLKTSTTFHFESSKQGNRIFSAGLFTFKPSRTKKLSKGRFIKDKTINENVIPGIPLVSSQLGFPFPPNPLQPPSFFPPNPLQPPSLFPPNPLQPPSLFPPIPNPLQPPPSIFPPIPNPFQPPPSIFPPIPALIPSPPPPLLPIPLPPNPFQPPPSVFPPITFPPLIPGIIPSPSPPPPPAFLIPLPPGFPGFPPPSKKIAP